MEDLPPTPDLPIALIVDDDALILDILRRMLRSMPPITSQALVFAQSSAEALALIQSREVATVLTDYTLDAGNGLQLIRFVKRRFPQAVAILSTGRAQDELSVQAMAGVVDYYLPKPFSRDDIVRVLGAALY